MKKNSTLQSLSRMSVVSLGFLASASLSSAALIYESFDDSDSTLPGNAAGTGLTGTWSGGNAYQVLSGSFSHGNLVTSGNRTEIASGRTGVSSTIGAALPLGDGETLWFSALHLTQPAASGNMDFAFAIGTDGLSGSNNIPMNPTNAEGAGFSVKGGQIQATFWDQATNGSSAQRSGGASFTPGEIAFIAGEIIWGSGGGLDTINLYTPGTDVSSQGAIVSTIQADLDQSLFDTITFANKADVLPVGMDEIRFGTTYAEVAPIPVVVIPEPSSALLLFSMIGLGLVRRHRSA